METVRDLAEKRSRADEYIPRVPALDAAEVNPERARDEGGDDEQPRVHRAEEPPRDGVHEEERQEAEEEAGPGGRRQEQHVVQKRNPAAAGQVLQVGDDVWRVRKEQQPETAESDELRAGHAGPGPRVDHEREQERDPGENQ